MSMRVFTPGDRVVYEELQAAAAAGQSSAYVVEHFMTVRESREKGTLVLMTGKGTLHVTHNDNPNVRRASLWERFRYRDRFPQLTSTSS